MERRRGAFTIFSGCKSELMHTGTTNAVTNKQAAEAGDRHTHRQRCGADRTGLEKSCLLGGKGVRKGAARLHPLLQDVA